MHSRVLIRLLFLAAGLAAETIAQTVEELPLRGPLPPETPQSVEEVVYRHNGYDDHGFNRVVQKITVPTLTIYHPAKVGRRGAAMVVCPGCLVSDVASNREG